MCVTCIIIDDEPHTIANLKETLYKQKSIHILKSFSGSATALTFLKVHKKVDIIFCDIILPGLNGIQAAKLLQPYCDFLIYVTAHPEYALEAFRVNAQGYLLKPVNEHELLNLLAEVNRLQNLKGKHPNEDYLYLKGDHKRDIIKLCPADIMYVQAMSNYISIYKRTNNIHILYMSLTKMNTMLAPFGHFIRISRSILINLDYLISCTRNRVTMEQNLELIIGETYQNTFHNFMRKRMVSKNQ